MKKRIKSKSNSLLPDYIARTVEEIDFSYLRKRGVKACFFDLDHTIVEYGGFQVGNNILKQFKGLDMKLYIATNRRYVNELLVVSKQINSQGIMNSEANGVFKPRKAYYNRLVAMAGIAPENIAMVGDRLIQDIWGANNVGVNSVLVGKLGPVRWWDRIVSIPDVVLPFFCSRSYKDV